MIYKSLISPLLICIICSTSAIAELPQYPATKKITSAEWKRHDIDATSDGADGIRLIDVNKDGRLDIATPWEEGDISRVYINPGRQKTKQAWPKVTVGRKIGNPEDVIFIDINLDGNIDVVSATENKKILVHFAPRLAKDYLNETLWTTEILARTDAPVLTSIAADLNKDGRNDLVFGLKNGQIIWFKAPEGSMNLEDWAQYSISHDYSDSLPMNVWAHDINKDGKMDVVFTLRLFGTNIAAWAQNINIQTNSWHIHLIKQFEDEPQIGVLEDYNNDGKIDLIIPLRNKKDIHILSPTTPSATVWKTAEVIKHDSMLSSFKGNIAALKALTLANIDNVIGKEIILTTVQTEETKKTQHGIFYLKKVGSRWLPKTISGFQPLKFDRVEAVDVDGDGDLDIISCEERALNAVFWYENPL